MADLRFRVWATIIYPESAPSNFLDIIKEFHIPFLLSPLHDKDINSDGSLKKPHYHLLFNFDGKKSYSQVLDIINNFNGVGAEHIQSFKGYARYLIHLDDKDKAQYNYNDVVSYMCDYMDIITQESDEWILIDEILEFIDNNCITNFVDLISYSRENNKEWFRYIVTKRTYFIKEYQKSLAFKLNQ